MGPTSDRTWEMSCMNDDCDVSGFDSEAYARRIGVVRSATPDLDYLGRIIVSHQMSVPFENLDTFDLGTTPHLDTRSLFDKIVLRHRGGYCFELNALLMTFLRSEGYDAWPITCRVFREGTDRRPMLHRASLVNLDGAVYYCDVGVGAPQPSGPVPLGGEYVQKDERFVISKKKGPWWNLTRIKDRRGPVSVLDFWDTPLYESYFAPANFYCAQSPDSRFRKERIVNMRTPEGSISLLNATFTEHRCGDVLVKTMTDREELSDLLMDRFGIEFPACSIGNLPEKRGRTTIGIRDARSASELR